MRSVNAQVFSSSAARRVHIAPFALRSSTPQNRAAIARFGENLRGAAYTHVLVATEDPGGYRLARAVCAKHRIGFVNGWGKPFKTIWAGSMLTQRIVRTAGLDARAPHECEVLFELGRTLVGTEPIPRDPRVLRPLVLDRDPGVGDEIVFQISDKWERLGIPFAQVTAALHAVREAFAVRAVAAQQERSYAERVAASVGLDVDYFESLGPWKAAIAHARALVAPDSGALHVAGMTGTPTIGVFPPVADFSLQAARWTPWAAPSRIIRASGAWPTQIVPELRTLLADGRSPVERDSAAASE